MPSRTSPRLARGATVVVIAVPACVPSSRSCRCSHPSDAAFRDQVHRFRRRRDQRFAHPRRLSSPVRRARTDGDLTLQRRAVITRGDELRAPTPVPGGHLSRSLLMQIRRLVLAASTSFLLLVSAAHAESNNYIISANGDCSFRWWGD